MGRHEKLFHQMREGKYGWKYNDLDALYRGYGFEVREDGKHTMYIHPEFKTLRATVARHRSLPIGYIQHAIKLIEQLYRVQNEG